MNAEDEPPTQPPETTGAPEVSTPAKRAEPEAAPAADHKVPEPVPHEGRPPADDLTRISPAVHSADLQPDATRISLPPEPAPPKPPPPLPAGHGGVDATRIAQNPTPVVEATRIAPAADKPPAPAAGNGSYTQVVTPGVVINDNYRILKLVSAGGMGEVYRAENLFTGDPVAVKIILPNLARDESIIDLFRREARILVQMRNDAIVRYHNFVRDRGLNRYCLIMEFVDGQHLWDYVHERGTLDVDQALVLMRRLANGLAEAHARGVTHRDLSPDNVILRENRIDEAVLIDFGIARSTELGDGLNGRFAGKFKYIAPEQLGHGRGEIGPAADVYGLALMIAAALRGMPLDMGNSVVEASEARRRIPDLDGISHRIYPILQYMLEPDPADRPPTMAALLTVMDDPNHLPARYRLPLWQSAFAGEEAEQVALRATTAGELATGSAGGLGSNSPFGAFEIAAPLPEAAGPAPRRAGRVIAMVAGIMLLFVLTGFGFWYGQSRHAPEPVAQDPVADPLPGVLALPARDAATREGFLSGLSVPACTAAGRIAYGPDAGKIGTLANGPRDFSALLAAYGERFGTRPSLVEWQVAAPQCPAVNLVHELAGRSANPPALSLDAQSVTSGGEVSGRIRDLGGRSLWLFLVSPKGAVYDLSQVAAGQTDGSFTFAFGISLAPDEAGPQPQLLLAIASDTPLASVAAAPSGSNAATLLPFALDEIRRNGGTAAIDVAPFTVEAPVPDPETPAPEPSAPD